jgi:NADH:ubiquinone oxidoreductase subunit F (NADH-binding)
MTSTTVAPVGISRLLAEPDRTPLPALGRDELIGLLREAGLTGRGGAGFPAWRKLAAVAASPSRPVVIGNGAEGEPASAKDRTLLRYRPDLVLDGLRLVAAALGARSTHLYAKEGTFKGVTVHTAPPGFISGEETAVAAAIDGRPARPADKLMRLPSKGVLVQNVETLAHIALIARYGPAWFREAGTPGEPGTFLATVSGAVAAPGVVEAGYATPLGQLLAAAGGPVAPLRAVLIGGYHGGWVPAHLGLPVSRAALTPYGASPGAGVVIALPAGVCGLAETARIAGYLAGEVAGQCGPCVNGLPRMADTLRALVAGRAEKSEVERLAALVTGRGACRHPDGTARMIATALRTFHDDVRAHRAGHCLEGEPR